MSTGPSPGPASVLDQPDTPDLSIVPDVSVVIVNWNVCDLLLACLASLTHHQDDLAKFEIIVVDNASSDDSVEMVRAEFPNVRVIANRDNRGFTGGNNQGLAAARGRYVMLLNPDTSFAPPSTDAVQVGRRGHATP